jgi:hypothetical protein
MFHRNTLPPSSGSKNKPSRALLATCFMLVSCLAYYLTLKIEVTYSSKTSVDFQWTTQHYIPEDRTAPLTLAVHLDSLKLWQATLKYSFASKWYMQQKITFIHSETACHLTGSTLACSELQLSNDSEGNHSTNYKIYKWTPLLSSATSWICMKIKITTSRSTSKKETNAVRYRLSRYHP